MTDEQRAKRLHHHMYETCEGIAEHAERIVRLEEENEKLRELVAEMFKCVKDGADCETCKEKNDGYACAYVMRELGIEVD